MPARQPWYVVRKDVDADQPDRGARRQVHPALFSDGLTCETIHWIGDAPTLPARLGVRVRYRQPDQAASLALSDGRYVVDFDEPQRAVTPGQWACFYDGDICLGGGHDRGQRACRGDFVTSVAFEKRAMALAGMVQAVHLVSTIARTRHGSSGTHGRLVAQHLRDQPGFHQ
ncbi:MAG: aminomethyltransferase beta-barrel domain-containing protein [Gammaproteobacteria bacterium]|nr:aminomethyltransferase beta-barrel domain-containing protein [Gammaproteobacteria bacterium]